MKIKLNDLISTKSLKYGTNSIMLIAIVVALVVFLNMMVGLMNLKWDITPTKIFSITQTTRDLISNIDQDVRITFLQDETVLLGGVETKPIIQVINNYKNDHITINYVDPDKAPNLRKELGIDESFNPKKGNIVVQSIDRITGTVNKTKIIEAGAANYSDVFELQTDEVTKKVRIIGIRVEQVMTGAILYVISPTTPVIYFTSGHGEFSFESYFTKFSSLIKNANYNIASIDLATVSEIPSDCKAIILLSPKTDLFSDESILLKKYLQQGGRAVFLIDAPTTDSNSRLPNIENIISDFNIGLNYDAVSETNANFYISGKPNWIKIKPQPNTIVPIENNSVVLVGARSLRMLLNKREELTLTELLKTNSSAAAKDFFEGTVAKGPFVIAAYVEALYENAPARVAVIGNSLFAGDGLQANYGDYGINFLFTTVNWVTGSNDINTNNTIPTKYYGRRLLNINANQANMLSVTVSIVFPLLILIIGFIVWNKRRHL